MKSAMKTILVIGLLTAGNAWSDRAYITASVDRLLHITTSSFGGCMAQLSVTPASVGLACRGNWVSFSCSGDFASTQDAKTNFEMAQLAYALDKEVKVWADDSRTHNQYCFVSRVDLLP